ncbi:MAG TPA: low affinity iron permease family protein [Candidatus Didemnitutus sp.]|jgi:low affinity Fe/Cu permease
MIPTPLTQGKHSGTAALGRPKPGNAWAEGFSRLARRVSALTAHPAAFALAVASVAVWAVFGPVTHYSEIWQLWINTSTTILTFLMVFLLQNAQTRDTKALHVKMDELLRALRGARNELIDLENLSEGELDRYYAEFRELHLKYSKAASRNHGKAAKTPPLA